MQIRLLSTEITRLEGDIGDALTAHPRTPRLQTLPRVATVSLAALITEIGPLIERCENPEQVAALCGAAPVTRALGESRSVSFRYTGNEPARVTITGFADTTHDTPPPGPTTPTDEPRTRRQNPDAVWVLARSWSA